MTLTFQLIAAAALVAFTLSPKREVETCVTQTVVGPDRNPAAEATPSERLRLVNACDRPLRIVTELTCPGRTLTVTRHLPAQGEVSWLQPAPTSPEACRFSARPAGW